MITDGGKWHYLAVKSLPALLREITSNHNGDFYCLNCVDSCSTENRLKQHERVCNDHDYCQVEMPKEDNKILQHNHGEKSLKALFLIYFNIEYLLKKYAQVKIILKNLTQQKKLSMSLLFVQMLWLVYLIKKRTNVVITERRTVLKGFVKSLNRLHWK